MSSKAIQYLVSTLSVAPIFSMKQKSHLDDSSFNVPQCEQF